jgi:hypothetical protein
MSDENEPEDTDKENTQRPDADSGEGEVTTPKSAWELLNQHHDNSQKAADDNQAELDKSMFKYAGLVIGGLVLFAEKVGEAHPLGRFWAGISATSLCCASVAFSILQYPIANMAIWRRNKAAHRYYIDDEESALNEISCWDRLQSYAGWLAAICLAAGLIFGIIFLSANLKRS